MENNSIDDEIIISDLTSEDRKLRISAVKKMGNIRDPIYINPLIGALKDIDPDVRLEAANSLYNYGPVIVEDLIKFLDDDGQNSRLKKIELLGSIGDPRAIDHIIPFLNNNNVFFKIAAAKSLGNFDDNRIIEPLLLVLNDKSFMLRHVAVEVLGNFNDKRVIEALNNCLDDESYIVRDTAKDALENIENNKINSIESLKDEMVEDDGELINNKNKSESSKTCGKCGLSKPKNEFYNNNTRKDGKSDYCISCMKNYSNKEKSKPHGNPLKLLKELRS